MAEYISIEKLRELQRDEPGEWLDLYDLDEFLDYVIKGGYTTTDMVEVVHGEWETKPNTGGYEICMKCSVCDFQFDNWQHIFFYCPVCGAKMDGEKNG